MKFKKRTYKKRKVVLRSNLRKARFKQIGRGGLKVLLILFIFSGFWFVKKNAQHWFSVPDFLIVQRVNVQGPLQSLNARVAAKLDCYKGQTYWHLPVQQMEQDLAKTFPILKNVQVRRAWHGKIVVHYVVQKPLALAYWIDAAQTDENKIFTSAQPQPQTSSAFLGYLSEQGLLFPRQDFPIQEPEQIVFTSRKNDFAAAATFLTQYNQMQKQNPLPQTQLEAIFVNVWDEVCLKLRVQNDDQHALLVHWGNMDEHQFETKYKRLAQVWMDLEKKSVVVDYIDLRQSLQSQKLLLGKRQISGRIIVHPYKSLPLATIKQ